LFHVENFQLIDTIGNICSYILRLALGRPRRRWEDNIKMDL
jgi:hypothetical protein